MDDIFIWIIIGVAIQLIIFIAISQIRNDIKRTNFTMGKIAKMIGVPEPSEDNKIKAFIAEGKKIKAVKRYREITGAGLREANDNINKLID